MNKLYTKKLFIASLLVMQGMISNAQIGVYNGKPVYQIEARRLGTSIGNIVVEMYPAIAPKHVRNFDSLVFQHFYDTTAFHRVVPGFVIQGGDPNSRHGPRSTWGFGDPSQKDIPAEFNPVSHIRGVFSAARGTDINSANSQFFICVAAATSLDNNYTAYGRVTSGMSVVDNIVSSPRDGNDNPFDKIEMFVTRMADDSSPAVDATIIQPADSASGITKTYLFKWNAAPGAQIYELELSKNENFDTIAVRKKTAGTSIAVAELQAGQIRYYWRVRTNNGGYLSNGISRTFTTGAIPPALVSPANNIMLTNNQPQLVWQHAEGAETYRVQIGLTPLFSPASIKFEQGGLTDTSFTVPDTLLLNKKYYWRVLSEISGIGGDGPEPWSFTTGSNTGITNNKNSGVSVYPNPAKEFINIITPETSNEFTLQLFGSNGQLLRTEKIRSGESSVNIDGLTPGLYFYILNNSKENYSGKFSVVR
jgi:peptidyl-prolyl cis-trans isomerase B (cyclophilin B)